jgi:hypothetical protein
LLLHTCALHRTALHPTALHPTALHPSAARYPLLPIGAAGAESIGVSTGANDGPPISYRCSPFAAKARHKMADHPLGFAHLTARQSAFSQHTADTVCLSAGPPSLPLGSAWCYLYSVFLVLVAAAPARAVAHDSFSRLSAYGSTVLSSGLWRPAMGAGSCSGIQRLVHTISPLALVPNFCYIWLLYNNEYY